MDGKTGKSRMSANIIDVNLNQLARSNDRKSLIKNMTLFQIEALKRESKNELKFYDDKFYSQHGRFPSNDEKEPLRHIYEAYSELRSGIHHKKSMQRMHRLQKLKTELKGQLKEYDKMFAMKHGGRQPTADEREPVREIYEQYCTVNEELSRIQSVVNKTERETSKNGQKKFKVNKKESRSNMSSLKAPKNLIDGTKNSHKPEVYIATNVLDRANDTSRQNIRLLKSSNLSKPLSPRTTDTSDLKSLRSRSGKPKKLGEVIMLGREEIKAPIKKQLKHGEVIMLGLEDSKQGSKSTLKASSKASSDKSSITRKVTFGPLKKIFSNNSSHKKKGKLTPQQEKDKRDLPASSQPKDIETTVPLDNRQTPILPGPPKVYDSGDLDANDHSQPPQPQEQYVSQSDHADARDDILDSSKRAFDTTRVSSPRSKVSSPRSQATSPRSRPTSPRSRPANPNMFRNDLPETLVEEPKLVVNPRFQNVRSDWAVKKKPRPRQRSYESFGTNATSDYSSVESNDSSSSSQYNSDGISYANSRATTVGASTAYSGFTSMGTSVGTSYASSGKYGSTIVSSSDEEEEEEDAEEQSSWYSSSESSSSSSSSEESEDSDDVSNLSIPTTFELDTDKNSIVASQLTPSLGSRTTNTNSNPKRGWLSNKRTPRKQGNAQDRHRSLEESSTLSSIAVSELQIEVVRTATKDRQMPLYDL